MNESIIQIILGVIFFSLLMYQIYAFVNRDKSDLKATVILVPMLVIYWLINNLDKIM